MVFISDHYCHCEYYFKQLIKDLQILHQLYDVKTDIMVS